MPRRNFLVRESGTRAGDAAGLASFLDRHERLVVLTGAGCSAPSGIPDYRDAAGAWKHTRPMTFAGETRPDGDARVAAAPADLLVPDCPECGGVLKLKVVFFGENVPRVHHDGDGCFEELRPDGVA